MDQTISENTSIYRPKINRDASTRDDVYDLEDLVPHEILDTLQIEAKNIINSGDVTQFGYVYIVLDILSKPILAYFNCCSFRAFVSSNLGTILRSGISEEQMIRKISIFLYIGYLIKFINTPMKNVTKKFVVCDKSTEVNNHILNTFSINSPSGR